MKTETHAPAAARHFIGVFTEDGLDQVCETREAANKERRDLIKMGCTVNLYVAGDESTLDAIADWIRDGRSFAVARGRVEAGQFAPETIARNAEAEAEERAREERRAAKRAEAEAEARAMAVTPEALRAEAETVQAAIVNTCGHARRARLEERRDSLRAQAARMEAEAEAEERRAAVAKAQAEAQESAGLICPPPLLNGYPVTAIQDHKNGFFTVMVIRDAHNAPDHARLVVATWWHGLGASWAWGHYIDGAFMNQDSAEAQAEAQAKFAEVAKRNGRRFPVAHLVAD